MGEKRLESSRKRFYVKSCAKDFRFDRQTETSPPFCVLFVRKNRNYLRMLRYSPFQKAKSLGFPAQLVDISKLGLNSKIKKFSYSFICGKGYSPP